MESITPLDAEHYLNYTEDDLYTLLVPEHARQQTYSKDGLIARGRSIFTTRISQLRDIICHQYKSRGANVKNSIDLTVLIGSALIGTPATAGIPILPLAALIVKIGLEEICHQQ